MNPLLLCWIAATVAAFWMAQRDRRALVLIGSSLCALLYLAPWSALCLAILASAGEWMQRRPLRPSWPVLIAPGLLVLGIHKIWLLDLEVEQPLALLGASYYCLRLIHGQLQRPQLKRALATREWYAYAFFAPVLLVGPFARLEQFQSDLHRLRWDTRRFALGLERMIYGHAKWIVGAGFIVGGVLMPLQASIEAQHALVGAHLGNLVYGLDLYLRFAGFSDIAIAFGALLGFEIVENFERPFIAQTIVDFWRRWHRSLSDWCRDYVYLPVVANRLGANLAITASMITLALWPKLSR